MERAVSDLTAFGETVVFLDYFNDLPDPRQAGKVIYPLPRSAAVVPAGGAGGRGDLRRYRAVWRKEDWAFCAASGRFAMERPRTITSATFLPSSTPSNSSAASWTGWRR